MKRSLMKDGKMLRECIEQYKYYSSGNNQMVVYTCLRDSRVFVPWKVGRVNDMAFINQNGKRYLPVFSNEAQQGLSSTVSPGLAILAQAFTQSFML